MSEAAVILTDPETSFDASRIEGTLNFFGIMARSSTVHQFMTDDLTRQNQPRRVRVFCTCRTLYTVLKKLEGSPAETRLWRERIHSVFVCTDNDAPALRQVVRRIVRHDCIPLIQLDRGRDRWVISDQFPDFCGSMSGLRILASRRADQEEARLQTIDAHEAVFVKGIYETVPVFLLASSNIVDVSAPLGGRNFDIREHFIESVPIVMFIKWAFANICWHARDASACLVIDDPLLRPTYGFLNYQDLLTQMERHNFTTNIAFIPWNWKRCDRSVIDMFRDRPERYSVSIHGCDHTGGEFGTQDMEQLTWKSWQAIDRMTRLAGQVGVHHDRIMVFPQGAFSGASMAALKRAQYLAAVNTEVLTHDLPRLPVTISDVWDVAVMRYSSFPIFTRRYPSQGVENFAFDILLGKPCILVAHHDVCRHHHAHLVDFIDQLNALNCRLSWCSLGQVVRRSCRQRELSPRLIEVEMYGSELQLKNDSGQQRRFRITRREDDKSVIDAVYDGASPIPWELSNGHIRWESELAAGQSSKMRVVFHEQSSSKHYRENLGYKVKVLLRRYLSEARDNYAAVWKARLPWVSG